MGRDAEGLLRAILELIQYILHSDIVQYIRGIQPKDFYSDKILLGTFLIIVLLMWFFRAYRALSLVAGTYALWFAKVYFIPSQSVEIDLTKLISFAIVGVAVGALWLYMFFIRED